MQTIDMTPTWTSIMPMLIVALSEGGREGREAAKEELMRVADLLDKQNALTLAERAEQVRELLDDEAERTGDREYADVASAIASLVFEQS